MAHENLVHGLPKNADSKTTIPGNNNEKLHVTILTRLNTHIDGRSIPPTNLRLQ